MSTEYLHHVDSSSYRSIQCTLDLFHCAELTGSLLISSIPTDLSPEGDLLPIFACLSLRRSISWMRFAFLLSTGEAGSRRNVKRLTATQTPAMIAHTTMLSLNASVNACRRPSTLPESDLPATVARRARSSGVIVPPNSRRSTLPLMAAEAASPKAPPKDRN